MIRTRFAGSDGWVFLGEKMRMRDERVGTSEHIGTTHRASSGDVGSRPACLSYTQTHTLLKHGFHYPSWRAVLTCWVLANQLILGQKVNGQALKVQKHTEGDCVAGVSYALYRVVVIIFILIGLPQS